MLFACADGADPPGVLGDEFERGWLRMPRRLAELFAGAGARAIGSGGGACGEVICGGRAEDAGGLSNVERSACWWDCGVAPAAGGLVGIERLGAPCHGSGCPAGAPKCGGLGGWCGGI